MFRHYKITLWIRVFSFGLSGLYIALYLARMRREAKLVQGGDTPGQVMRDNT